MFRQVRAHPLIAILCAAFLLRCGLAVGVQSLLERRLHRTFLVPGDADGYWELAHRIVRGDDFAIYEPPRYVLRMPGFPLFLAAGVRLWGDNFLATRISLAAIGTLACGLVYALGREIGRPEAGLVGAAWGAVSPLLAGMSVLVLSETLFACGVLLSLWTLARLLRATGWAALAWAGVAGLALAAACYVRPSWLLWAPVCVACDVGRALLTRHDLRGAVGRGVVLTAAVALALAPWTVRNYYVTGHVVPTTLWMGPSLYDGLHPGATGDSDMTFVETDRVYQRMSEYDADQHYRAAAWEFVRTHPGRTAQLALLKLGRYWSLWPNAEQVRYLPLQLGAAFVTLATFGLALIGAWSLRTPAPIPAFWAGLLTLGPILYFAALHAVFVGSVRYRLPAEYPLLVLTGLGAVTLFQTVQRGTPRPP